MVGVSAEFSDDLIRHCEQKALEAVAAGTADLVRAVLRASGYAELVAALEPFVSDGPISQFEYVIAKRPRRAALAAARQPQGSGE